MPKLNRLEKYALMHDKSLGNKYNAWMHDAIMNKRMNHQQATSYADTKVKKEVSGYVATKKKKHLASNIFGIPRF